VDGTVSDRLERTNLHESERERDEAGEAGKIRKRA
jgi:hypothetical protein